MERRLAAILSYDVVGYSRAMGVDEVGTLEAIKSHRREVINPKAAQHGGRIIKLMGDGGLMEFASVVDAVAFAVAMQCAMADRNAALAADQRLLYRVGINVGDVIIQGDDIYGDGVNVAARLEGLAPPGGICVHRNVRDQVRDKLALDLEDLGEVEVKNIDRPVRAFYIVLNAKAQAVAAAPAERRQEQPSRLRQASVGLALSLVLIVGVFWWQPWAPDIDPVNPATMAHELPAKPSIAVLAFDDLSQGPDRDYLSDAISEGVITELSRFPELFVIARNSSFKYKDTVADIRGIARELGVRYVLEGSQQKAGGRLRVTVQLIDAVAGNHIWANSYDRDLADIFAVQDEITRTIVSTVASNVEAKRIEEIRSVPPSSLEAFDFALRGKDLFRQFTKETHLQAREMYEKAIALDPDFAGGYVGLTWTHINGYRWGWTDLSREESLDLARDMARKAVALAPRNYEAHWVMANVHMQGGDRNRALSEFERALVLNPNADKVLVDAGELLVYLGRPQDAVRQIGEAIRLNPHHPDWYLWTLGWARYYAGDYEGGLAAMFGIANLPNLARRTLAAILVRLGRIDEAKAVMAEFLQNAPDYTAKKLRLNLAGKFHDPGDMERFIADLRVAGLPE
jgi:TolB-like protein/class 3 adenylate cyclase/Tfp pilus assembly protein PilF